MIDSLRLAKQRCSRACTAYLRGDRCRAVERCQRALAEGDTQRAKRQTGRPKR